MITKLSAAVVVLMALICLPVWGQTDNREVIVHKDPPRPNVDQPKPPPRTREPVEPPTYSEPEICKSVDNLPKDHVWTGDEAALAGACEGNITNGRRAWPSEESIKQELAREKAEEETNHNRKTNVVHGTAIVTDKDGNPISEADQLKMDIESRNSLIASGKCLKAAQDVVKNNDECVGKPLLSTGRASQCQNYFHDATIVSVCAVAPDDPQRGYKRRAIAHDPMPTSIVMANEKQ